MPRDLTLPISSEVPHRGVGVISGRKLCGDTTTIPEANAEKRDKNGVVLTRTDDQLNQWKEQFQEFLNRLAPDNPPELTKVPLLDIRIGQVTIAEVKRSLKSLKNGKASGCDNIPPEAWKEGGIVSA